MINGVQRSRWMPAEDYKCTSGRINTSTPPLFRTLIKLFAQTWICEWWSKRTLVDTEYSWVTGKSSLKVAVPRPGSGAPSDLYTALPPPRPAQHFGDIWYTYAAHVRLELSAISSNRSQIPSSTFDYLHVGWPCEERVAQAFWPNLTCGAFFLPVLNQLNSLYNFAKMARIYCHSVWH